MLQSFSKKLDKGWRPAKEPKLIKSKLIDINVIKACRLSFQQKINSDYSPRYKKDLTYAQKKLIDYLISNDYNKLMLSEFDITIIREVLNNISESKRVQLNYKRNYSSLFSEFYIKYKITNPFPSVKLVKQEEVLHKPIIEIKSVLEELTNRNKNLHLCCILAYGCLLRPHREIRNLKWGDFNENCTIISLSGARNKEKKIE